MNMTDITIEALRSAYITLGEMQSMLIAERYDFNLIHSVSDTISLIDTAITHKLLYAINESNPENDFDRAMTVV